MKKYIIFSALIGSFILPSVYATAMVPRHDHKAYVKHQKHHKHHKLPKFHGIVDATYN
jgi:hypothetical protein